MALLKSKAAKAAAMTDATRLLSSAPATDSSLEVSTTPGSTADWSISQLSAIYKEHRTQLVSQARRITRDEAEANEVVQGRSLSSCSHPQSSILQIVRSHTFAPQSPTYP